MKSEALKKSSPTKPDEKKRAILLVDDHPLFRKGMMQLLDAQDDLKVRCEAGNSGEALNAVRSHRFDLAVVDVGLRGGANGIELTKSLKAEYPDMPVLVVSMHDEALYAERALRAGARGYVMKNEALDSILHAVRSVMGGETRFATEGHGYSELVGGVVVVPTDGNFVFLFVVVIGERQFRADFGALIGADSFLHAVEGVRSATQVQGRGDGLAGKSDAVALVGWS